MQQVSKLIGIGVADKGWSSTSYKLICGINLWKLWVEIWLLHIHPGKIYSATKVVACWSDGSPMPLLTQWSTCRFMRPWSLFCVLFPPKNNIAYQQNVRAMQQRFCMKSTSMIPLRIAGTLLHEVAKALKTGATGTCNIWPDSAYTFA